MTADVIGRHAGAAAPGDGDAAAGTCCAPTSSPTSRSTRWTGAVAALLGSETLEAFTADTRHVAGLLPDVRVEVLEGQAHTADGLATELVADRLLGFLRDNR